MKKYFQKITKNKKKIIGLILLLLLCFGTFTTVYASTLVKISISGTYNYDESNKVFDLVNQERNKVGVGSLELDYDLCTKANERAREAAMYFSHTRPNGEDVLDSLKVNGENIAGGSNTAAGAMDQWMNSSGHKANILDKRYKSIGIGSYTTENGATFWVQVFSFNKASNKNRYSGSAKKTDSTNIRNGYIKDLRVLDLVNLHKSLKPGEELQIKNLELQNAGWTYVYYTIENKNATFTSSNSDVASINSNGLIKAYKEGTTKITARVSGVSKSYDLTVKGEEIHISSVSFDVKDLNLKVGESYSLKTTISPENTTDDKTLKYYSSHDDVATVDKNGNIKAVGAGSCEVVAKSNNSKVAIVNIKVVKYRNPIKDVDIRDSKGKMEVGDTYKLGYVITPSDTDQEHKFTSSNTSVATIDNNGNIKAVGVGKTTIALKGGNYETSYTLEVVKKTTTNNSNNTNTGNSNNNNNNQTAPSKPVEENKTIPVERVTLGCSDITIKVGEVYNISYQVFPNNATNKDKVTFMGTYYKIAEYNDRNLTITGKSAGDTQFTIYAGIGPETKTATCKVHVVAQEAIERLEIPYGYSFGYNEAHIPPVKIYPTTASISSGLKITSSDPSIISVSEYGVLLSHEKSGTAVITVTAPNGVSVSKEYTVK